ncbi:hypothetical protein QE629_02115, partial [Streptococcus suis]|uniref:hypothetical protein n=1 Tax=Streptococcus suis TaxID=1307 RepID=UPI003757B3A2
GAFPVSRAQAKKTRQGLNSLPFFHAHEKMVLSCRCAFHISRVQEKIATQGAFPVSRAQAKKTRQGLNSLPFFHAREKMVLSRRCAFHISRAHEKIVHTVIALFAFLERKKKSPHRAIFLIFVYEW